MSSYHSKGANSDDIDGSVDAEKSRGSANEEQVHDGSDVHEYNNVDALEKEEKANLCWPVQTSNNGFFGKGDYAMINRADPDGDGDGDDDDDDDDGTVNSDDQSSNQHRQRTSDRNGPSAPSKYSMETRTRVCGSSSNISNSKDGSRLPFDRRRRRQEGQEDPEEGSSGAFRVLTFNSWVGDYRRGYLSRDSERLSWIEDQLRAANAEVLCLQEVLESDTQKWYEDTFADYEFLFLHQESAVAGKAAWLLATLGPALLLVSLALASTATAEVLDDDAEAVPSFTLLCATATLAVYVFLERLFGGGGYGGGYPSWARHVTFAGFPLFGAKNYFHSTNASLGIGVRKSFGTLCDPSEEWFEHQGLWWHCTVAGLHRELKLFNPDRWLNCLRKRGILSATVTPHHHHDGDDGDGSSGGGGGGGCGGSVGSGQSGKQFRVVNMHLNIGVSNPEVRLSQMQQVLRSSVFPCSSANLPVVLCGDTNGCANFPEKEMAWLVGQEEGPALLDCWEAVGSGGKGGSGGSGGSGKGGSSACERGWTWDRSNALTHSGPLLEPDQRTDVVFVSTATNKNNTNTRGSRSRSNEDSSGGGGGGESSAAPLSEAPVHKDAHQRCWQRCWLKPVECEVLVYPKNQIISDHYAVLATLSFVQGDNDTAESTTSTSSSGPDAV